MTQPLTLLESIQRVDNSEQGHWCEVHPAWRAIVDLHPRMIGMQHWQPGAVREEGNAWDWEIALSMIVRGYGADVVRDRRGQVLRRFAPGLEAIEQIYRYTLPPLVVALAEEEEYKPVDPAIAPLALLDYYGRTITHAVEASNAQSV